MPWFRHEATAHRDGRLIELGDEFGPNGIAVWWQLNEACCLEDGPIIFPKGNLKRASKVLSLDPDWGIDLAPILSFLVRTGLVLRHERNGLVSLEPANREKYMAPKSQTKEAQRERKRRSRAKLSHQSHSDGPTEDEGDVTPYDTNETDDTKQMVPTGPALPATNGRRDTAIANKHLRRLEPILASGSSFDLVHEFRELWGPAWQEAIDAGITPTSVGRNLLATFIATVTDTKPDYGRAGQLVGTYGKLALLGINEGIVHNADDPYTYANRVCENKAAVHRSEVS